MTVVVGVDGAGRTHRLRRILAAAGAGWWFTGLDGLAAARGSLVVVDDAHRLDAATLLALTDAARSGTRLAISRRPTITGPELAGLDELAAEDGVEVLAPLDRDAVAALVAGVTGRPVSPERAAEVHQASAGLPLVAAHLAGNRDALLARIQRRFALLPPPIADLARVLALDLDLPDEVLAASLPEDGLAAALRTLREEGLLAPGTARMVPALAGLALGELSAPERRSLHDRVARAMIAAGADPLATATRLRAARVRTPAAAEVYLRAGEAIRFTDPATALSWFDDAADAGALPAAVAPGRAETATLLGLPADTDPPDPAGRLTMVAGAAAAHDGRAARGANALLAAPPPGPLLAVPLLACTGGLDAARTAVAGGTGPLAGFAAAAVAAAEDPDGAVPLLIEAAENLERATPVAVLPDTPHAIGAVVAVAAGDLTTAEHLLTRAGGLGGPVAAERHRLLLAWARMRAGRYDTALAELRRDGELPGRERLLKAAIRAGIARRRGDIAGLHAVWDSVEPVLARRAVDLWQLEAVEELLVAAARLKHRRRVEPVLAAMARVVPPAWQPAFRWVLVQVAIADGDAEGIAAQARSLPGDVRGDAARMWADVLGGKPVEPDAVHEVTGRLAERQLPWEASRLAGQAAINTPDPAAARRLLERARELSDPDSAATPAAAGLSERELDVARMVLGGSTHREIGAQLFISPKTVEHHVARIRGKLGATSRAELLAMLREIVPDDVSGGVSRD